MRNFAANYLIDNAGMLLKNGIIHADEQGNAIRFIDTRGDLRETELLAFHNGIIFAGQKFSRTNQSSPVSGNQISELGSSASQLSLQEVIELAKQRQAVFPEKNIPEILNEISAELLENEGFVQVPVPGIYLLSGANLPELKFTAKSRIRRIF